MPVEVLLLGTLVLLPILTKRRRRRNLGPGLEGEETRSTPRVVPTTDPPRSRKLMDVVHSAKRGNMILQPPARRLRSQVPLKALLLKRLIKSLKRRLTG
jgi:hypothetical protein